MSVQIVKKKPAFVPSAPLPKGHEIYHVGLLALDRDMVKGMSNRAKQKAVELSDIADWWFALAEKRKAVIYQRKVKPFVFEYIGVLTVGDERAAR